MLRLILALAVALAAFVPHAAPAGVPAARVFTPLESMFHTYGDAGATWEPGAPRTWTGGDSTYSVPLPDGRTVWMFSDTFLGPSDACSEHDPSPCHRRRIGRAPLVNNTFVVQEGDTLVRTLHGGTEQAPRALIEPAAPNDARSFYWMGDGTVEGNELHVFVRRYPRMGVLPFTAEAVDIATFSLPGLTLERITPGVSADGVRPWAFLTPPVGSVVPITWGAGIFEEDGYTYVYGTEEYPTQKHLHVARAPSGSLVGDAWEYWNGTAWSPDRSASARVLDNVAGELSVARAGDRYRLVASELGIGSIVAYDSPSPAGPWTGRRIVHIPQESSRGAWAYNAHEHPQHGDSDTLVLSYNVNGTLDGRDIYNDTHIYRPRFIAIEL